MSLRHHLALLAPALGLALSSCAPSPPAAPAQVAPAAPASTAMAVQPTPMPTPPACPHADFDTFLKHFGNEITLQEKATADPLLDTYIDAGAEPEPREVERRVALADVEWPVMPDPSSLSGRGREMTVTRLPDGQMEVVMRTPNSSDQQRYTFAHAPCWQLVRRDDESI